MQHPSIQYYNGMLVGSKASNGMLTCHYTIQLTSHTYSNDDQRIGLWRNFMKSFALLWWITPKMTVYLPLNPGSVIGWFFNQSPVGCLNLTQWHNGTMANPQQFHLNKENKTTWARLQIALLHNYWKNQHAPGKLWRRQFFF